MSWAIISARMNCSLKFFEPIRIVVRSVSFVQLRIRRANIDRINIPIRGVWHFKFRMMCFVKIILITIEYQVLFSLPYKAFYSSQKKINRQGHYGCRTRAKKDEVRIIHGKPSIDKVSQTARTNK